MTALEDEAVGKPGVVGVYTIQRLSLSTPWEGPRKICQGFKPDSGNPTVRHYRGASGTVRHGETVTPSRNRKSGHGNPSPTARRVRFLSRPSHMGIPSVPWHHTLERVLIRIPGVHCAKLGAPSLFRSSAQESIVYLVNWADSSNQIFALIGADLSMAGPVAQSAWIAR